MRYKLIAVIAAVIISGLCVNAQDTQKAPAMSDGLEHYYQSMRTCTPTVYKYDSLMMGIVNTNQVIGQEDGKCVIKEEINPQMVMVCKLPMRIKQKYANEHLKMLKENIVSDFVQKNSFIDGIKKDARYCQVQAKQ